MQMSLNKYLYNLINTFNVKNSQNSDGPNRYANKDPRMRRQKLEVRMVERRGTSILKVKKEFLNQSRPIVKEKKT